MAFIMLGKTKYFRDVMLRLDPYNLSIPMGAAFGLMLGLFLVVIHNVWAWEPRLLITIISWLIIVKSVLWLGFPVRMLNMCKKMYAGAWFYIMAVIMLVAGVFLLAKGFYLYIPAEHLEYTIF